MEATLPGSDLERRKKVRLRLRPDLDIAPHRYEGRTYFIVKDPVSLRYYRFKEQEHFLLQLMDGRHTLDDAQKEFEKRFRPERLTLEDLEGFGQQLLKVGLAHNESPQAGKLLFDHRKKRLRREWLATFTNILYIKIPIFDPDRLLRYMLNKGLFPSFLRTPINVVFNFWLAFTVVGGLLTILMLAGDVLGVFSSDSVMVKAFSPRHFGLMLGVLGILFVTRRLSKDLKFIFTTWFLILSVSVMLAALALVGTHFETFWDRLPEYKEFFSFKSVVYLWIALGAVKVIHEFGHGLSCKAFGGEVHEMGALFLCLSPCLYCNVSDAWTLPSKWKRIIISFAGIYVELIIAAIATFVWWYSPGDIFINRLSLSLMVVCSVSTVIFNGNPLMRYDGYYILADWLEIPNLRDRSNRYLQKIVMEHCLGIEVPREQYMALWRRMLFLTYAVVSYIYRWVVTFSILYFLYNFLKPYKLGAISGMMAIAAAGSMAGWPLWRLGQNLYKRGRLPDMKSARVMISTAVIVILVIGFFTVPLPISRIRQTGVVQLQPDAQEKVFVPPPGGILERLEVRSGQEVYENQVLAHFRSLDLDYQYREAQSGYESNDLMVRALDSQIPRINDPEQRGRLEKDRVKAMGDRDLNAQRMQTLEEMRKRLDVVRAPRSGIVLGLPNVDEVGKTWDKDRDPQQADTPLCTIGDPQRLRVLIPVVPQDYELLKHDLKELKESGKDMEVTLRVQGLAGETWNGRISVLPQSAARDREIPPGLTSKYGGPLAIRPGANPAQAGEQGWGTAGNTSMFQGQHYLIAIDIDKPAGAIAPGTLAQAKIHCRWRTGAWWVWRWVSSTFDLGLM